MSDDGEDSPPPLPGSPPPTPLEDVVFASPPKKRRMSDRIKSLQKMLSDSGGGMYMDPSSPSSPAPPPNKKPSLDEEQEARESPKLVHVTKSRPKRKVRPPSTNSLGRNTGQTSFLESSSLLEREERIEEDVEEEPPPPIPISGPPGAPPSPPPSDSESSDTEFNIENLLPTTGTPMEISKPVPTTSPPVDILEPSPEEMVPVPLPTARLPTEPTASIPPPIISTQVETISERPPSPPPATSTPVEAKPLMKSSWSDVLETKTPHTVEEPSAVSTASATPSTSTSTPAKAIVIGSFSDRLKKLQEKRAAKSNSNSSLSPTSPLSTTSSLPPVADTTDNTSLFSISHMDAAVNQNSSPAHEESPPTSVTPSPLPDTPPEPIEPFTTREETIPGSDSEEDDLPPAPPPPIPDLPPPSDEASTEPAATSTPPKSHTLTSKVSFRTLQWKDEWTRKSEQLQLDSFKPDNLPIFGSSSSAQKASPIPEARFEPLSSIPAESNLDDTSSSGSVPSIPDSLPPELPEGPPPTLPDAPPPDTDLFEIEPMETGGESDTETNIKPPESSFTAEDSPSLHSAPKEMLIDSTSPPSFRSLETSTPNSNGTQDYSLNVVKLRPKKSSPSTDTGVKRRSAFDALVSVEPTAEEKNEIQLTAEERRKITVMASRLSSADADVAQQAWSKQSSLQGTPAANTPQSGRTGKPRHSTDSLKASTSESTSRSESPTTKDKPQAHAEKHQPSPALDASSHTSTPASANVGEQQGRPVSFPSSSNPPQQIRVISEGTPPSSPDVRYTRRAREKWSVSPKPKHRKTKKLVDDDLSASASTGNILEGSASERVRNKPLSLQNSSSLQSVEANRESLKTELTLPWSKLQKQSSKKDSHPISPLAAASVSTPPQSSEDLLNSQSTLSWNSTSDEAVPTKDSSQEVQADPPKPSKFLFPDSPARTPSTFKDSKSSISSKENFLSQEIPGSNKTHEQLMEKQLAKVKEQGKMTLEFFRKDRLSLLRSMTPKGSPMLQSVTRILGTDIYKTDPSQWTEDQVCKWLELVGLGSFRENFRQGKVDGKKLLQMDIRMFDELGIDSPEIREIFLAKIYELSNPSSAMEDLEDDFLLSVDDYTTDDWKKFEAAVSALKSPSYNDSIELEPSAIGQFIHSEHVRSQSTPNLTEIDLDAPLGSDNTAQPDHKVTTSKTAHSFDNYNLSTNQAPDVLHHDSDISSHHSSTHHPSTDSTCPEAIDGNALTKQWVAGLPNVRRKRALTDPIPAISIDITDSPQPAGMTLPRQSQLSTEEPKSDPKRRIVKKRSITPRQMSIQEDEPLKLSSPQRSPEKRSDQCLVKLYMNTVQEGALYKSFLIAPSTTSDDLIAMALEKAYLGDDHNLQNYTIWDRDFDTSSRSSLSRQLKPKECPVVVQSQWQTEGGRYLELRRKEGILLHPTPQKRKTSSAPEPEDFEAQIRALTEEKNRLLRELSLFHSELQDKRTIEEQLESLTEEYASTRARYKVDQQNKSRRMSEMQSSLHELSFENTQLKDQLSVTSSGDVSSDVLVEMQAKYAKTVETLKRQLSESIRDKEELARKNVSLEEGVSVLGHASEELQKVSRLLREHQQQLKAQEQKLAEKEETIHSLRKELDKSKMAAKHEEQLSLLSGTQEHSPRPWPLYTLLDTSVSHRLILAEVEHTPSTEADEGERSLSEDYGIQVSGSLGNCVVSEVTEEAAAAGIQTGDRLLEINGSSVAGMTQREIDTLLTKQSRSEEGALKIVSVRATEGDSQELSTLTKQGSLDEELIGRYKKLSSSPNLQLDSQTVEADKWRSECERLKSELLKYSSMKKDRDLEHDFLESRVSDLKAQLEDSEKARVQLREMLDRLGTEKASNEQLKELEAANKKLMTILRDHLINIEDLPPPQDPLASKLAGASQSELLSRLAQSEGELTRHKTYLEQLLSVVIDQEPHLLTMVGEAQRMRDQLEEADEYEDSWC